MESQKDTLDFSGKFLPDLSAIPEGIKQIAWARTIRWFGWGFGEMLLPIFILSFSKSLTAAGLASSAYDVLFLASLPIVGLLSDAVSSKTLLIMGAVIYPFIGLSYYLAGAMGMVLFVILGRALNGVSYCLDTVGTDTYIRRSAARGAIASAFGYMASLANFGWLVAGLLGAYLVHYFPINDLLFLVTPFALVNLVVLARAPRDAAPTTSTLSMQNIFKPFVTFLKEIVTLRKGAARRRLFDVYLRRRIGRFDLLHSH